MKDGKKFFCYVEKVLATEPYVVTDEEGSQYVKTKLVKVDAPNPFKDMKASDFQLENIQAAGATHLLRPVQLKGDIDDTIANVGDFVESLENNIVNED